MTCFYVVYYVCLDEHRELNALCSSTPVGLFVRAKTKLQNKVDIGSIKFRQQEVRSDIQLNNRSVFQLHPNEVKWDFPLMTNYVPDKHGHVIGYYLLQN